MLSREPYHRRSGLARFTSLLLLLCITCGALVAQKVLVCDVAVAAASHREAALVASLKRLQGTLASRNAESGGAGATFSARGGQLGAAGGVWALTRPAQNAGGVTEPLSAPEKVRYDRRIAEKEMVAQRAKKAALQARSDADVCREQLAAALAAAGRNSSAESVPPAGSDVVVLVELQSRARRLEGKLAAAVQREVALQGALDEARAANAALRAQVAGGSEEDERT